MGFSVAEKSLAYNDAQRVVGAPLKTLKGSVIKYSPEGVGKYIDRSLYFHKLYVREVEAVASIFREAEEYLRQELPGFHANYNCLMYDFKKPSVLRFDISRDFDTAREPGIEAFAYVDVSTGAVAWKKAGASIWHHKWLWVQPDYQGFSVKESWLWSKLWLSTLQEPANGNSRAAWEAQLLRYGLPLDD